MYILNRDAQARLTISSPLEAHKSNTLVYHMVGVDVGFENPTFACLEIDYEVSYQNNTDWRYSFGIVRDLNYRVANYYIRNPNEQKIVKFLVFNQDFSCSPEKCNSHVPLQKWMIETL